MVLTVNIYAPNIGTPKYVKHKLPKLKGEINTNTVIDTLIVYFKQQ